MKDINQVQAEAKRILAEGLVDEVVAFKPGTLPMKAQPAFISAPQDAAILIMDGFCQNNLAVYLRERSKTKRVGLVCRGCESRAVIALTLERQIQRENLYLIGVPCEGILDWKKIQAEVEDEIVSAQDDGNSVTVETAGGNRTLDRGLYVVDACRVCTHREPVGVDVLLGELEKEPFGSRTGALTWKEQFEGQDADERYRLFSEETDRCIRCYACREACPMCYCEQCFVDHSTPRWNESMLTPGGAQAWHLVRAFHQTGRCVECGACERACPMDIKMVYLTDRLNEDMLSKYQFEVGADAERQPPFATLTLDDKNRFIRQG